MSRLPNFPEAERSDKPEVGAPASSTEADILSSPKPENHSKPPQSSSSGNKRLIAFVNHLLAFLACLLAAHYVLVYQLDAVRPSRVLLVLMLLSACFGFDLRVRAKVGIAVSLFVGMLIGLIAVFVMSAVVWSVSDAPFIGGKQERLEFVVTVSSIMLAYMVGTSIAGVLCRISPDAFAKGDGDFVLTIAALLATMMPANAKSVTDRLTTIKSVVEILAATLGACGALWLAAKGLFGG